MLSLSVGKVSRYFILSSGKTSQYFHFHCNEFNLASLFFHEYSWLTGNFVVFVTVSVFNVKNIVSIEDIDSDE